MSHDEGLGRMGALSSCRLRLARLKEERKMTQCCSASCATTSRCTRGVAVAVSASSGTLGYLH